MFFVDDIKNVFEKDPAARNVLEVLLCYPGLHALWMHRIAHAGWNKGYLFLARLSFPFQQENRSSNIWPATSIGTRDTPWSLTYSQACFASAIPVLRKWYAGDYICPPQNFSRSSSEKSRSISLSHRPSRI
jgi:hypothetical protein